MMMKQYTERQHVSVQQRLKWERSQFIQEKETMDWEKQLLKGDERHEQEEYEYEK